MEAEENETTRRGNSKACRILKTSRSSLKYQSIKNDNYLMDQLNALAQAYPTEGFWKSYYRLRNDSVNANHKRHHRVYNKIGLPLRRKLKKHLPSRIKEATEILEKFIHTWSVDFVTDALSNGRKFRSFNVIDD